MTELRLLRMEPILARSIASTAAAPSDTGAVSCATGRSAATDGSALAGNGADAPGFVGYSICCSNGGDKAEREKSARASARYRLS